MKKVAMLQSNYIPWKGVFDLIHRVDTFVFYDDVQYTKRDWRNRNKIPTQNGELWLSVPVITKDRREQRICDVEIDKKTDWQNKHYRTLSLTYTKAPYYNDYKFLLDDFYIHHSWDKLSEMNIYMTKKICEILGIQTEFVNAVDLNASGGKDGEKVINICKMIGCDYFINGPASKAFMNEEKFAKNKIVLEYMTYEYPEYKQLTKPFSHQVSVLDLIFNTGKDAPYYIWGWKEDK